jgi:hypothetical protein
MVPPLSFLALFVLLGCALSMAAGAPLLWLLNAACLGVYLLRGWSLSGMGLRGLSALARAPFYVLWNLAVLARRAASAEWVRTPREEAAA